MKRGSVIGFEVRIRFIVMSFLLDGLVQVWYVKSNSALRSGAAKPVCEMAGTEQRILAGDQAPLLKRRAEVAGLLVRYNRARIMIDRKSTRLNSSHTVI